MADGVVGLQPVDEGLVPGEVAGVNEVEPVADRLAVLLLDRGEVELRPGDAFRHGGLLSDSFVVRFRRVARPGRLAAVTHASNGRPRNGHGRRAIFLALAAR